MEKQSLSSFIEMFKRFQALPEVYDAVRIVDPLAKKVFELKDGGLVETSLDCSSFWGRNDSCENCTSCRAVLDNETYVKIENTRDTAYMVTSVPFVLSDSKIVIELLKNINKSLYFTDSEQNKTIEIYSYIKGLNTVAVTDGLTGAYNRRFLDERLPTHLLNRHFKGEPVSVILADLDNFKYVNDTYGHSGGDVVLREFCVLMKQEMENDTDWVVRYGGEEFLLCLPSADIEKAFAAAERIRKSVEEYIFLYDCREIKITVSFGVAEAKDGETAESLLKRADSLLYRAKANGKNRVEK